MENMLVTAATKMYIEKKEKKKQNDERGRL